MRTLKILIGMLIVFALVLPLQAKENKDDYLLIVNIYERTLILYKSNVDGNRELKRYPVAVPTNDWLPLPLIGKVKRIEFDPWWYPTEKTRIAYFKRYQIELPKIVGPGDSKNGLGKAKIIIIFKNFDIPIRIHGASNPETIGKRASRGCIRMYNEDVLNLAGIIKNSRTKVIIK